VDQWIDWLLGQLTPAQWDSWRNWLATIGGLIALSIAALTYRRNVRLKREEQARLVYSKMIDVSHHDQGATFSMLPNGASQGNGSPFMGIIPNPDPSDPHKSLGVALAPLIQATVIIHNGSKELIGPARVQMVNGGNGKVWDQFSISVGAIDPETDYVVDFTWLNEFHPGQPSLATTVIFRDASGQWWRRHRAEPIERVHNDPENVGMTPPERKAFRAYQESIGIEKANLVPEPRPSLRVRWHRYWRTRRGKSPIP
jgi:hypothetical protein